MGAVLSIPSNIEKSELWQKCPKWVKFGLCNLSAHVIAFWGPNALLYLISKFDLLQCYKIQQGKSPPAQLVMAAFQGDLAFDFMAPFISWPFYKLLAWGGVKEGEKEKETQVAEQKEGWSGICFGASNKPSWFTMLWQVAVAYLAYDFMFYFSHRALHSKLLYKDYHKQHHAFVTPVGVASSYQGSFEGLTQMFNWWLPVGLAGWMNGSMHISTIFAYNCFRWIETVDAHCGYNFPFSPFSFFSLFGGAVAHDFHHSGEGMVMKRLADGSLSMDFGNYGATVIWDKLLGTVAPAFYEYARRIRLR